MLGDGQLPLPLIFFFKIKCILILEVYPPQIYNSVHSQVSQDSSL